MSRPTKLSSKVFLELPPVLAHYLESERNMWLDSNPNKGKLTLLNRLGAFVDLESLAVERRQQLQILGLARTQGLAFRTGFEQGRRDGARHFELFGQNVRLALQSGPVFAQLQGRFVSEQILFEFDLDAGMLMREILLHSSAEAIIHRMAFSETAACACWNTAGYLSGQVSEILGRRVITVETECVARGDKACRLVSRLDSEWDASADCWREALRMPTIDHELAQRDELLNQAQASARKAQRSLLELSRKLQSSEQHAETVTMIAGSQAMEPVIQRARVLQQTDVPFLIWGERGSGRETLAKFIHQKSKREEGPFVVLETRGMTPKLLQQELLGFAKGAFPGAFTDHKGALQRAHRGTLFLTELGELSHEIQHAIIQFVQTGMTHVLGAEKPVKVDARVVTASESDPTLLLRNGKISEELFYALTTTRIDLPPLRDRETDVIRIAEHFARQFAERYERPALAFSEEVKEVLLDSGWPGNIRQLHSVIEHAVAMSQEDTVRLSALPEEVLLDTRTLDASNMTLEVIQTALKKCKGNRSDAARRLGIGRTTLWRHMKRHGIA